MKIPSLRVHPAVGEALLAGRPVVALESTLVAHGLPRPDNLVVARSLEELVQRHGAVSATVGVVDGVPTVGLDDRELPGLAAGAPVAKLSVRDLPMAMALGRSGATTVSATAHLAALAGVSVFATGGLGGVHREARETWDESADLSALARTGILVVCAGVKSILDVGATLERLETLGVPVVGYRTDDFPGFYLASSGHRLDWRADDPAAVADVVRAQRDIGLARRALVVANALPPDEQLDPTVHEQALRSGLDHLEREGISGKDVTPVLLDHFHRFTAGESLRVNVRLVERNVEVAAAVAGALSRAAR